MWQGYVSSLQKGYLLEGVSLTDDALVLSQKAAVYIMAVTSGQSRSCKTVDEHI